MEGHWRHSGVLYRDDLVRVVVDVPDSTRNRQWMRQFKERWKVRLEQVDLRLPADALAHLPRRQEET